MVGVGASTAGDWRSDLARLGRSATIGATSGMFAGFVVGGIGGRVVMLVLRLASDDRLQGIQTDDDFEIGRFSSATAFLLVATTILGAFGGLAYMGVRRFIPASWRWASAGLLAGATGGAAVLDADGIDFTLLDPLLFAVVAFIALPATFGVLLSLLVERRVERQRRIGRAWPLSLLPLVALLLVGSVGVLLLLLLLLSGSFVRASPRSRAALGSPQVTWLARGALAALLTYSAVQLVRDITAIY